MELFDIIKSFTNDTEWNKVTQSEKSKNFFMINRLMSIQYPIQANGFNVTKIDPVQTVEWWKKMIGSRYNNSDKKPTFIFTKTTKKEKINKKEIPLEILQFICEKHEISMREIGDLLEFYPKEFNKYCESVKEMLS